MDNIWKNFNNPFKKKNPENTEKPQVPEGELSPDWNGDDELVMENDPLNETHEEKIPSTVSRVKDVDDGKRSFVEHEDDLIVTEREKRPINVHDIADDSKMGVYSKFDPRQKYTDYLAAEDSSFEDRNILADMAQASADRKRQALEQSKKDLEKVLETKKTDYDENDFMLMRDAAEYNDLIKNGSEIMENWPRFSDNEPLTYEQIQEQVAKFKAVDLQKRPKQYSDSEMLFMRECFDAYKMIDKKRPVLADGQKISDLGIDELVAEYNELKAEHPQDFDWLTRKTTVINQKPDRNSSRKAA